MKVSEKPEKGKTLNKHPQLYTIFKPNELIKAKKFNMSLIEKRVYYEILNYNHEADPSQTVYKVPYEQILHPNELINGHQKRTAKRISEALQKRIFFFDSSFMKTHFSDDAEVSMNPFPEVSYYSDHFKVSLWPRFKKILTMIGFGFTKGDIDTLRSFKHDISDEFYWQIRRRQFQHNVWEVDLEELKETIGLEGKYGVWQNFKAKVLDPAKDDCKGTWVEFDYKAVKKGRGSEVRSIIFYFKNGPKQEVGIPVGEDYLWETKLLVLGVDELKVKEIRSRVKVAQENMEKGFSWDGDYVRFSLEAIDAELKDKKKHKNKKQIRNLGGYVYSGLVNGLWLDYVNGRKAKIKNEVQKNIDFSEVKPSEEVEDLSVPAHVETVLKENPVVNVLTESDIEDWKSLHLESGLNTLTFEEFMNKNNYYLVDGKWVR